MVYIQPSSPSAMQDHDELAALFTQHMNFNPEAQPKQEEPTPPTFYSITQHYHHSAHARPDAERASSEPRSTENAAVEAILRNHGVDPSTLTPSQLSLFKVAESSQKRRLLELWSICPPNQGGDIPALAWSSSTLEHEEQLARLRYERTQQHQQFVPQQQPAQSGDGRWHQESEPYMTSGYAELMRREQAQQQQQQQQLQQGQAKQVYGHFGTAVGGSAYSPATDPVYLGADHSREQQQQQQQMAMATQYGAFDHFRANGDGDSMTMDVM